MNLKILVILPSPGFTYSHCQRLMPGHTSSMRWSMIDIVITMYFIYLLLNNTPSHDAIINCHPTDEMQKSLIPCIPRMYVSPHRSVLLLLCILNECYIQGVFYEFNCLNCYKMNCIYLFNSKLGRNMSQRVVR